MTELELKLKRENLTLRIELTKAQAQVLQRMHDDAVAELKELEPDKPENTNG